MRVHKAAGGAVVRAQRMEQTISPTLHGRTRTNTSSCTNVCASAKLLQQQEWPGNVCNIRKCSSRVCLYVCASLTPMKSMYAADSLGPEDISQKGRRRSRSNPEGCSFSQPSGSLSSLPPFSSSHPPVLTGWGRRRKLLLCSTFAGNDPATRMRPSLFPFILVPVSGER